VAVGAVLGRSSAAALRAAGGVSAPYLLLYQTTAKTLVQLLNSIGLPSRSMEAQRRFEMVETLDVSKLTTDQLRALKRATIRKD
jgi:hypothetical protein